MSLDLFDVGILLPAFLAGLLVLSTHVPLGQQVLARGIIFIDLAVAQIAGLGVLVVHQVLENPAAWTVQLSAAAAALVGALLLYWSEQRWPKVQEAIIGAAFVLSATGAILVLSTSPHAGEQITELLAGQILWVSYEQLWAPGLLYAFILLVWATVGRTAPSLLFYVLFALAVTASVQLVGLYLVFASLVIPALATWRYPERSRLLWSYGTGIVAYTLGIVISVLLDLPTGATIVWSLAVIAALVALRRPRAPALFE